MVRLIKEILFELKQLTQILKTLNDNISKVEKGNNQSSETADIFRIKEGPKKGLLTYKKPI